MGFLESLKRFLGDDPVVTEAHQKRHLNDAWNVSDNNVPEPAETNFGTSTYDRDLWVKKLRHTLADRLPLGDQEWHAFLADAYARGFERDWVDQQQRVAFELLVRKAVSDGVVTSEEHHQIELARVQIGLSDTEAESLLNRVLDEAKALIRQSEQST